MMRPWPSSYGPIQPMRLEAEGATEELTILDRQLALSVQHRPEDDSGPVAG